MFSEIVDTVIERTNRVDLKDMIIDITNGVIRRIQSRQYFLSDLVELDIPTSEMTLVNLNDIYESTLQKYIWERTPDCRIINSVQFLPSGNYPPNSQPSIGQDALNEYWYKVGDKYCFITSDDVELIRISYYKTSPALLYEEPLSRNFKYDWVLGIWTMKDTNTEQFVEMTKEEKSQFSKELAYRSNWLLRDYREVVISGAVSKVFGILNDTERFRTEFAEFGDLFKTLTQNEKFANFSY